LFWVGGTVILRIMKALVLTAVVAMVIAWSWYSYVRKQRRRRGLASFAQKFNFDYAPRDPFNLLWDYNLPLFEMGDGRGTENVVSGEWKGLPFRETDYWYYTKATNGSDDKTKSYKHFNAVVIDVPAYLPKICIERESVASRLAEQIGFRDIQFESEKFNRSFRVTSDDRAFAFKLIDPQMMHWLLTTNYRFAFQCYAGAFIVFATRLRPTELLPLIGTGKEFFDHIPRLVWTEYGTGPAESSTVGW
jgi:hypothetical protein